LREAIRIANTIHVLEYELVRELHEIDKSRFYIWQGYKSLRGYCNRCLRFSLTQSQRLTMSARRYGTTSNIAQTRDPDCDNPEFFED
jgi:hypothetical protein